MLRYVEQSHSDFAVNLVITKPSRRTFLGGTAAFMLAACAVESDERTTFQRWEHGGLVKNGGAVENPLIFVSIDTEGTVTLVAHRAEMGTGVRTSLPMVIADEMEADWSRVKIVQAEADEEKYGNQDTDGSRTMRHFIQSSRIIGGAVRHMLREAAAKKWNVDPSEVVIENHKARAGDREADFGELAELAMSMPIPEHENVAYKSDDEFRYVGKSMVSITDLHDITTGKAVYGADIKIPGMKYAAALRPPVIGGKVKSHNGDDIKTMPGVIGVYELPSYTLPGGFAPLGGIAVVADNTWSAFQARDSLIVEWEHGPHASYNSSDYMAEMKATSQQKGKVLRKVGDPETAFANAAKVFRQTYSQDHMAHAPMEPPVAVADFTNNNIEVWAPVQSPQRARDDIALAVGLDAANVKVNVTLLGGGFGRKSKADYAIEAAILSKMAGLPVRMQWSREDDIRHSFYHTTSAEHLEVAIDEKNEVLGWRHNSVAPSFMTNFIPDSGYQSVVESGLGHVDTPFKIDNMSLENGNAKAHTRIGWFRSVSNIPHAWAIGSFVGELAQELGKDDLSVWKDLIGAPRTIDPKSENFPEDWWNYGEPAGFEIETGRMINVLDLAAKGIGYGKDSPANEGIGLAVHRSFIAYVAAAARVKIVDGMITVPEMHIAIDAGFIVNPERVRSQLEGAAVMGMTAALHSSITFTDGAVDQSNFYDYDVVRADNYPVVTTHLVDHPFMARPGGVGEPGVPPIAPAIANGLFHATGQRKRHLPMGVYV